MGGDFAKCICVPDTLSVDSDMDSAKKYGEKDSNSDSDSYSSSGSESCSESGSEETTTSSDSDESSSSHRKKRKRKKRKSAKEKKGKKGKSKKNKKTHKKHRSSKYGSTSTSTSSKSSSESETDSGSSTYESDNNTVQIHDSNDSNDENNENNENSENSENNYSYEIVRSNSMKFLVDKQRKKQEDLKSRKLALIEQHEEKKKLQQQQQQQHQHTQQQHKNEIEFNDSPRVGRHPRIPSMSYMDPTTIQLLTETDFMSTTMHNTSNTTDHQQIQHQSRFDPNYSISAEPKLPNSAHSQQYYNNNNNNNNNNKYRHAYSQSGGFPNLNNLQPFPTRSNSNPMDDINIHNMNNNNNNNNNRLFPHNNRRRLALRPSKSNPVMSAFSSDSSQLDNISCLSGMSIVDDIGINEADDLPAMPSHNNINNDIFDISRAGLGTLFQENSTEIMDNISNVETNDISPKHNNNNKNNTSNNNNGIQNEININNLNNFFIHNAGVVSPPVDKTYKPIPSTAVLTTLSKISESSHASPSSPSPCISQQHTSNTLNNTSNESNVTNKSSNYLSISNNSNSNANCPNITVNGISMNGNNNAMSSPDDDEETVARQWMDLHKCNIADDNLPATDMDIVLSFNTEMSSDQERADEEIKKWKKKRLSQIDSKKIHDFDGVLAPQSSDEEEDDKFVKMNSHKHNNNKNKNKNNNNLLSPDPNHDQSSEWTDEQSPQELRAPHLLRPKSLVKWKSDDLKNQVRDMQRQVDYLKQREQIDMEKTLIDLQQQQEKNYITK